ncbi:hypothetical protein E4T48_00220 [Aureobasidium sp. EXF-10727]|nr:hypothetical protein E4T48_00220 [Aureobasidium sp. EXF-10727]KAI4726918.1 hypothetical protein E4T49_05308 [Aureobasidium sp. EXF-10728]
MTDNQVSWTYDPVHPEHIDSHRHESQPCAHNRPHQESKADAQHSDPGDACFETMPVSMNHYTFVQGLTHEDYFSEKHETSHWDWSQTASNIVPLHPPLRTDVAIQDLGHLGGPSYFSKPSPLMVTPRNQISPTSSCWDIDDNASLATTHTTTPTDLVPDPPTEMVDPPSEDMNPSDKTMLPQRRNLKDPNHLYMPRWIRGDGKQREGWCGSCRPGKWLSLKRSTYWYHKNFCHGITVMGTPFPRPARTRALADDKGWEGYCRSCNKWIVLNGGKKSHTSWFRHAYKCDPSAVARSPPSGELIY